jgi:GxxExxY protein
MEIEEIGRQIVDAALKIHKALGPGLLESTYQTCLAFELRRRGVQVDCEVDLPIRCETIEITPGYRLDMIVGKQVIVENKSVENLLPVHKAQVLTYLRLRDCRLGFLINWNVPLIKDGIHRMANHLSPLRFSLRPSRLCGKRVFMEA